MTLFTIVPDAPPIFAQVLQHFFNGVLDEKTLYIVKK